MDKKQRALLARRWTTIASSNGLKRGTKAYSSAEFYFWQGVLNYLDSSGEELPAFITICLMSGRSVSEEVLKYPFSEGDDYYTIENYTIVKSCWDDVSEELHDENPDREYFSTIEEAENSFPHVNPPQS
jgi:hypothetical protein